MKYAIPALILALGIGYLVLPEKKEMTETLVQEASPIETSIEEPLGAVDPVEIPEKRTYNSNTFQNPDGSFTLRSHTGQVNYKDDLGAFQKSDISFTDMGTYWEMTKHSYRLRVAKQFDAPVLIQYKNKYEGADHTITYEPKMLAWVNQPSLADMQVFRNQQPVTGTLNGNVIRYTNAFGDGIHFEITLMRSGFKKEVVIDALNKLENPPTVNHKLVALFKYGGTGLKILKKTQEEWDGSAYFESEDGFNIEEIANPVAKSFIKPAYIVDSSSTTPGTQKIKVFWKQHNGDLWQAKILPRQFLLNAVYPVRADTVTQYFTGAGDGGVWREANVNWTDTVNGTGSGADITQSNTYISAISDRQANWRFYHGFFPADTSGIGSGSTISAASLNIYQTANLNTNPCTFSLVETTQSSTSTLASTDHTAWVKTDIGSNTIAPGSGDSSYRVWNFSDLTKINKTGWTKVGIAGTEGITLTDPGSVGNQCALQLNHSEAASNDPYYEVTYTEAGGGATPSGGIILFE